MRHFPGKAAFGSGRAALAPRIIPLAALVFALFALTACGGGGSASTGPGVAPPAIGPVERPAGSPAENPAAEPELPTTSQASSTATDTSDPVVDPVNAFEAISWRLSGEDIEAPALTAMSVMSDGTLNVPGVGTIPASRVNIVKTDSLFITTPNLNHIEFGVWAEGDIPSSGNAGATFATGSFFRGLGTDATKGLTTEQALRYNGIRILGQPSGVANWFKWKGQYVGYVEDNRPNYVNADTDGNPQGTVGVSRVAGSLELYLVWPTGYEKGFLEINLGTPVPTLAPNNFSPGFDRRADWTYGQQIRFTGISANPSGTFEAYSDYPVVQVIQTRSRPQPLWAARTGCVQACLYPTGIPVEEGQVLGGFYGPAGQEAGGIYRFTIPTWLGDVRATGAFGGKRLSDNRPALPSSLINQ